MSEQPPRSPLQRHLSEWAERTVPDDLDLWPEVQRRLRDRGMIAFNANGASDARDIGPQRAAPPPLSPVAHHGRRWSEFMGAAVSFALAALAIAFFAFVAGRPGAPVKPMTPGSGATTQFAPAGATPPATASAPGNGEGPIPERALGRDSAVPAKSGPTQVAGPDCTFDIDVSVEAGPDIVEIAVRARANWACGDTGTPRLAIVDASGARSAIAGNPLTLPLRADGRERHANATAVWSNWCGDQGRVRIETTFGDEQESLSLRDAPRCVDAGKPSTLRMTPGDKSIDTPAFASPRATPTP